MELLAKAKELELFWEQPRASQRNYVLNAENRVFGNLVFKAAFSTLAEAELGKGKWTFKRVGCFSTHVTARRFGSELDIANYYPKWTGTQGQIRLSTGEVYYWNVENFLATRYAIRREGGFELITYLSGSRSKKFSNFFKQQAWVEIRTEAWQIKELPLLVVLGWYLIVLHYEDSGAAASVAVLN